ncbi:MAG: hypothetical protein UT41_C0003G0022 [Candidatus Wolfebacteria bacterium GW2011_GWC2_39_22]|uniref:Uncharacterized protein n=1 Tax=Candidatus Wolfebacteria bacterium GW2011_GWC2_39_22 TaxID=1619013 RepID=A0A0G0QP05_9BACT|nr:MAG: hypothetical protein UT41_C0003G0022 [Candidatus Wolfebacteria bacterium GW2011_GWC2_39_22]HBI25300.1 hypothetical protein [Candidatus Wolfebacteria bacterium]
MKKLREYFVEGGRFENASVEMQEKIRRLCGIAKKFISKEFERGEMCRQEWEGLCKEIDEILECDEKKNLGNAAQEITNTLPVARFISCDYVWLPNGIIIRFERSVVSFHDKWNARNEIVQEERRDAEYMEDHWL